MRFCGKIIILLIAIYLADAGNMLGMKKTYQDFKGGKICKQAAENQTNQMKPVSKVNYPINQPASKNPLLQWTVIEGAVLYELEFLHSPPENPNGIKRSQYCIWSTREIYKNGYIADLSWAKSGGLYWRVRALDYYGNPLGVFSDAQLIYVDQAIASDLKPFPTPEFNKNGIPTPLYPVYGWIPIPGAANYEVEVCSQPPENPNGTQKSKYRIWHAQGKGNDLYDEIPRNKQGTYYWRVLGLDAQGKPVGVYSDASKFEVDLTKKYTVACFGDSITHGGGALSYSPSDWEYDYQTYLDFMTLNLGRSGDTTASMVTRFNHDVLPFCPQYLIILGGTNSIRGGIKGAQVIRELTQLNILCQKNGIRPIFLTLPPINPQAIERVFGEKTAVNWREEMDVVNQFIRRQKYYIDIEACLSDNNRTLPEEYSIDGLHPDIKAKNVIAKLINENWLRVTQ